MKLRMPDYTRRFVNELLRQHMQLRMALENIAEAKDYVDAEVFRHWARDYAKRILRSLAEQPIATQESSEEMEGEHE